MLFTYSLHASLAMTLVCRPPLNSSFLDFDIHAKAPKIRALMTMQQVMPRSLLAFNDRTVLSNRLRLSRELLSIWQDIGMHNKYLDQYATVLPYFVSMRSPYVDANELVLTGDNGFPISAMVSRIGLRAVPSLLKQLDLEYPKNANTDRHRRLAAEAILRIYNEGGEGRILAIERIRLFSKSASHPNLVLESLSFDFFQDETIKPFSPQNYPYKGR